MSKRRKDPRHQTKQSAAQQAAPSVVPPAAVETATDKRQNRRIFWTQVGTVISIIVSTASAVFTYSSAREAAEANALTRQAQDRAAGKVRAKFEFVPDPDDKDSSRFKPFVRKQDAYDNLVFRIENVDELIRWGPAFVIKNTGTEPIDAIKVDIDYVVGSAYGRNVRQLEPTPFVMNDVTSYEATSFGKMLPGQTARVSVGPMLLQQLTEFKWQDFAEKDHNGVFSVDVKCRLVGATSYDQVDRNQRRVFEFHWRPAGFKPDAKNVREYLAKKPSVVVK